MQHFLNIADFSTDQLWQFLQQAKALKDELKSGGNAPLLQGKVLGMIFEKPSLRTRVSFEVGMLHLGGQAIYLSPQDIGLGKRESIADVSRVLSSYVDGIMARVFSHEHLLELAEYSQVPVINGLSDYNHPCQALTDVFTMWEHFGKLDGLNLAFVGDGNNVITSLLLIAVKLGINVSVATPQAYQLPARVLRHAREMAEASGATITVTTDPQAAVTGADVVYTDVWTSMGQEAETAARLKIFPPYQLNQTLLSQAKSGAVAMHDLPAHRGEEITDDVADGPQSIIFQQAENRLHAQKGVLARLMTSAV